MICNSCNSEIKDGLVYCPFCGAKVGQETPNNQSYTAQQSPEQQSYASDFQPVVQDFNTGILGINKSLLLTVCILLTVSVAASVLSKSIPIFALLYMIFLWIFRSKISGGVADYTNIRRISGTVFAEKVLMWVLVGLIGFAALIFIFSSSFITDSGILGEIFSNIPVGSDVFIDFIAGATVGIIGIAFLIAAVVLVFFNIFGIGSIHRFVQSLYLSIQTNNNAVVKANAAKNWLLVFGIFSAISAFGSSALSFISNGCTAAAYIILFVMIKKQFCK